MTWYLLAAAVGFAVGFVVKGVMGGGPPSLSVKPATDVEQLMNILERIRAKRESAKKEADDLDAALKGVGQ